MNALGQGGLPLPPALREAGDSMACNLVTAATFRQLQSRLLEDLRRAGAESGWAPKWVVVPSASLANHLRFELSRGASTTAMANVRVVNVPQFAQRLALSLLRTATPPWGALLDLLLWGLVEDLPPHSPLVSLRTISGGPGLLRTAFVDLAEAGLGPGEIWKLEELAGQPDMPSCDRELLLLYVRWVQLLQERQVEWAPLVLQRLPSRLEEAEDRELAAVLGAEAGQSPTLYIYGFYDWIDVHLEWLGALSRRVATTVYYPWRGAPEGAHPAFEFTGPVRQYLRGHFAFTGEDAVAEPPEALGQFFLETFPEGPIGPQPDGLSYQRAAGTRAEVISAAIRIRAWLDDKDNPLAPEEILVVAPQADAYADVMREIFAAFAIPVRIADVACGPTPESAVLRMLARIWEEQAPAEWVLGLLRACPDARVARGVNLDQFEGKVRELGIWGGAAWRRVLADDEFPARGDGSRRPPVQFNAAEKALIREIIEFVPAGNAEAVPRITARDARAMLDRLQKNWMSNPTPLEPLVRATEELARWRPSLAIERRQWTQLVAESDGVRRQRDPRSRAVLFLPMMRARGLTARGIVILGLAAGQIPFRVPEDPLLSELASARLAEWANQIGHRLPLKARLTEELLLLFSLINTAGQRVHWVVPETDAAGKAVAPTPWVQRYFNRWENQEPKAADPLSRRIARAPFEQAIYLAKLDPKRGEFLPPALALFVNPKLAARGDPDAARSWLGESIARRGKKPEWSGSIQCQPDFRNGRVNVTSLEALAQCPFRFYGEQVAGWKALEALSLSHELAALARGSLLHKLLEEAVRPYLRTRRVAEIAAEMLAQECAKLHALAQRLSEFSPAAAAALALLPEVFQQAARRQMVRLAAAYFEAVLNHPAVPQDVEMAVTKEFPGIPGLMVAGKIDRVDHNEARVELLDYKSGKMPPDYRKRVKLGWQIQAVLYPWLSGQNDACFRYIFLGRAAAEEGDAKGAPEAAGFLSELAPLLQAGHFIPTSNQVMEELGLSKVSPCRYCALASACRRFEPGAVAKHARLFEKLAPARCASLRQAVKGKPPEKTD